jgi:hypothetical protein
MNSRLTYQGKQRTCGFRLSHIDIIVLIIGMVAGVAGYLMIGKIALFAPYVIGHFFLFCNVFRIRRKLELIWATLFVINCAAWIHLVNFNVYAILFSQLIFTFCIIANEIRHAQYHGVFCRRLNLNIKEYLNGSI